MKGGKQALKPTWSREQALAYCKRNNLPLPPELSAPELGASPAAPEPATGKETRQKHPRASLGKKRTMVEFEFLASLTRALRAGEILKFEEQSIKIAVGEPVCWYTPDFSVWMPDGTLKLIEVKGPFAREDSIIKYKAAVRQYPHIKFEFHQRHEDGTWSQPYAIK